MENNEKVVRPTKKQKELLTYLETFIAEHGYSPSYREIMNGVGYTSVATVALHINNLIKRGHVKKRDNSARSLEVIKNTDDIVLQTNEIKPAEEKWLVDKVDFRFSRVEQSAVISQHEIDQLYVLIGALRVLGVEGAAQSFIPRLTLLKGKVSS